MNSLQFIIILIQIVVKGCMKSTAIKAAIILLGTFAAVIFIPHWVGLLIVGTSASCPPPWVSGLVIIGVVGVVVSTFTKIYVWIYNCIEERK